MKNDKNLADQWKRLENLSLNYKKELFASKPGLMIDFFLEKMLGKENIEIGVFLYGNRTGSVVSYRELKKEITLRLKKNSVFEMVMMLVNIEGELHTYIHKLSKKEIDLIPDNLKNIMFSVRELGRPVIFDGNK
jgi:hypothetical protein